MFSSNTSAVSGDANYIEDVFSTYLFTGTGTATAINNGIDLSTKGGLVWIKDRNSGAMGHALFDTARGGAYKLQSQSINGQSSYNNIVFGTTGFTNDTQSDNNNSGTLYSSWTFRKQPKFFDVVTYTGTGSAQNIAHSLGSTPGCVIVKRTDDASNWAVYHRGLTSASYWILLNNTLQQVLDTTAWNATAPTSTQFTVGSASYTNTAGGTYVAYIFAHDAGGFGLTGTDNVITCGSLTVPSSGNATVTLGYEPQWVMVKRTDSSSGGAWIILDNMRGMSNTSYAELYPNTAGAESASSTYSEIIPTATGFIGNTSTSGTAFINNATYIYIAIRRGPMKVPTDGTKVFAPVAYSGDSVNNRVITSNFPVDLFWDTSRTEASNDRNNFDRLRGAKQRLEMRSTGAESTMASNRYVNGFDSNVGTILGGLGGLNVSGVSYISYAFQRAPSFFDEVCYTGTGSNTTQTHNLGVVPELVIVRARDSTNNWQVYNAIGGVGNTLLLNTAQAYQGGSPVSSLTSTSAVFAYNADYLFDCSGSGVKYVAYLFATCAGVSKVGGYTGTGTTKQVDCGFAAGARFVLIKRTDAGGDWHVWDSARGIVSGNDPYFLMNNADPEVTSTDYVDTYAAGFELTSTAPAAINASGGTYIFLAIA